MGVMYWDKFMNSGSVEDYLYYKGVDTCSQIMESYNTSKERQTGGENVESNDHSYRNHNVPDTYGGIR